MKIRSITYFLNPGWPLNEESIKEAGKFVTKSRTTYESSGYEVQTTRLATVPFPFLISSLDNDELIKLAKNLEILALETGFDYVSLGPALPELSRSYEVIPVLIGETHATFFSGMMTCSGGGVSLAAVQACADIIYRVARLSTDGFTNLRFGAAANVPPGGPFFPASYLGVEQNKEYLHVFALATEAADLAIAAINQAKSLENARDEIIKSVEKHARAITRIAEELVNSEGNSWNGLSFGGIDFTMAPFPQEELSFGSAIEGLGVPAVGLHGSLAAAAFLTHSLDLAKFQRVGFNGLMLPLLEDAVLAKRGIEGSLSLMDLLLYSAVCGTGLDTLPLPGDVTQDQLASILLDLSALAQRLDKPLIARLMPIPGKNAGDLTSFEFPFFANSRVLAVRSAGINGLLGGNETFRLLPG